MSERARVKGIRIELSADITLTLSVVVSELYSKETDSIICLLPSELVALMDILNERVKLNERGYLEL